MPFVRAFRIASRELYRRRGSMLTTFIGVVLCGALFAVVLAVTYGQDMFLRSRLFDVTPQVTLLSERNDPAVPKQLFDLERGVIELVMHSAPTDRREIKPHIEVSTRARRSSALIVDVAPMVLLKCVYRNGARFSAVDMRGVDPTSEKRVSRVPNRMLVGSFDGLMRDTNTTVIGSGLAQRLDVKVGDDVTLVTAYGTVRSLVVVGVFETGVNRVDTARVYVNLAIAQSLRRMPRNAVTALGFQVTETARVGRVSRAIERSTGFRAATWEVANDDVLTVHRNRMLATWFVAGLFVIVAAFGVANFLLSGVVIDQLVVKNNGDERSRLGSGTAVVLLQGIALGTLGGTLAAIIGFVAALILRNADVTLPSFASQFVRSQGNEVSLAPGVFVGALVATALATIGASIGPALRAGRRA